MSYSNFLSNPSQPPSVVFSESESASTGLRFGRLNCPVGMNWGIFEDSFAKDINEFDIVVLRYPSTEVGVAEMIQHHWRNSWLADTLIFSSLDVRQATAPDEATELVPLAEAENEFEEIVAAAFEGYTNHYASNSHLRHLNVSQAYADWTRRLAKEVGSQSFVLRDNDQTAVAFTAVDISDQRHNDLKVAGVHPAHQGKGMQTQVMRHLAQMTKEQGKDQFITSTQAANIPSMRSFVKEGFMPVLSVNTLHIMPRLIDSDVQS